MHLVCFGEETWNCMHFLVILSLKTLWAGVKHWRTALHRFYVYRKPLIISTISQFENDSKMSTFEVHLYYEVWTTDLGFCQVSLLTHFPWLFFVWPSLHLFTATHTFLFLSFTIFFSWSVIGVFFLFSWPSIYVSYWFTVNCEILKNGKF